MIDLILGRRYKIIEQVGVGGMAIVYKAEDLLLKRFVAIKVLKEQFIDDAEFSSKFELEAQSAAGLQHPNIVSVYDVGTEVINEKRINYIVMEFINGKTLKNIITEKGSLSNEETVNYTLQIASALVAAHRKNIIHRDIKPQNIMITDDGILKVTDFGIARISTEATLTYTTSVLGTVHYISPEQAKGKHIDYRSDLYSLGIVMYEMLIGRVPFDAENSVGIALKHINDRVIPPKVIRPTVSNRLDEIIMKCLEKNPDSRFQNASALIRAIQTKDIFTVSNKQDDLENRKRKINNENNKKIAVYKSGVEKNEKREKKAKKSIFSIILPIFLGLLVVILGVFVINQLSGGKSGKEIELPSLEKKSEEEAKSILDGLNLKVNIARKYDDKVDKGLVIEQKPQAKTKVREGSVVELTVSDGFQLQDMPDLTGKTIQEAKNMLESLGLTISTQNSEFNDKVENGKIINQTPSPGSKVDQKVKISVSVSKGQEEKMVKMPDLLGSSETAAIKALHDNGLEVGTIERVADDKYPKNTVSWQLYKAGDKLKESTPVDIIISDGKKEEKIPNEKNVDIDVTNGEEDNPDMHMHYKLKVIPPAGKDSFLLKITKVLDDGTERVLYTREHMTSQGEFEIVIKDYKNSKYNTYYDNELVKSN